MYRSILRQPTFIRTTSLARVQFSPVVTRHYSILDTAKEKLQEINLKVGKAAASGLETAEDVTHAAQDAAGSVTESIKDKANETGESVKQSARETGADAREAASSIADGVEGNDFDKAKEGYEQAKHELKKGVNDVKHKGNQAFEDVKHEAKKSQI